MMNTAELIYQKSQSLPESVLLEVLEFMTLAEQKLAGFKKNKAKENEIIAKPMSQSEQAIQILERIAEYRQISGNRIDIDEFEKSRQDRELDR